MPSLADLFLACKGSLLFGFQILIFEFGHLRDLTCDFAGIFGSRGLTASFTIKGVTVIKKIKADKQGSKNGRGRNRDHSYPSLSL
jgi:hypothetical protein